MTDTAGIWGSGEVVSTPGTGGYFPIRSRFEPGGWSWCPGHWPGGNPPGWDGRDADKLDTESERTILCDRICLSAAI